mgnify:CR=1 FL=1
MKRKYTKSKLSKRYIYKKKSKRKHTKKRYNKKKKTRNYSKRIKKGGSDEESTLSEFRADDIIAQMKLMKEEKRKMQATTSQGDDAITSFVEVAPKHMLAADFDVFGTPPQGDYKYYLDPPFSATAVEEEDTGATAVAEEGAASFSPMNPQNVEIGMMVETNSGKKGKVVKKSGHRARVRGDDGETFWCEAKDMQLLEDAGSGEGVESEGDSDESILPVESQPEPEVEPSPGPAKYDDLYNRVDETLEEVAAEQAAVAKQKEEEAEQDAVAKQKEEEEEIIALEKRRMAARRRGRAGRRRAAQERQVAEEDARAEQERQVAEAARAGQELKATRRSHLKELKGVFDKAVAEKTRLEAEIGSAEADAKVARRDRDFTTLESTILPKIEELRESLRKTKFSVVTAEDEYEEAYWRARAAAQLKRKKEREREREEKHLRTRKRASGRRRG